MGVVDRLGAALSEQRGPAAATPHGERVGAVLALFRELGSDDAKLLYTRRHPDLASHPGQVSFPGGRVEPGESPEEAAVREAHEEVALDPATVEVVGRLPGFYIPPSRFWLQTVVARWRAPHRLHPAEAEVEAILTVRIAQLRDPSRWRAVTLPDRRYTTWAWQLDGPDVLWGATAIVTAVLLDLIDPGWAGGVDAAALPDDRRIEPWTWLPPWTHAPADPTTTRQLAREA